MRSKAIRKFSTHGALNNKSTQASATVQDVFEQIPAMPQCSAADAAAGVATRNPLLPIHTPATSHNKNHTLTPITTPASLDRTQLHVKHLILLGGEEGGGAYGGAQLGGHHDAPLAAGLHALDAQLKAWDDRHSRINVNVNRC
jgi:hypothetical protein